MNKTKKLVLVAFSLMAIVSCGGGGSGSGNSTSATTPTAPAAPVTPAITRSTAPRLTMPDFSKLDIEESVDYNVIKEDPNGYSVKNTGRTYYDVRENEIGFKLWGNNTLNVASPTTMDVRAGGVALASGYFDLKNPQLSVREILTRLMTNANNLTLNMNPNSYLFMIENTEVKLSETNISDIMSGTSINSRPKINGTDYKMIKFHDSNIRIDQNVNLDDPNDTYNKLVATNSIFSILKDVTVSGTKDNQIAIQAAEKVESFGALLQIANGNAGEINLKGNNSIGAYVRNTRFSNGGKISVDKNSIGIYLASLKGGTIWNGYTGSISLGESSTGMYLYVPWIDFSGTAYNQAKIESNSNNVIGMVANVSAQKKDPSSTVNEKELIYNQGEIELKGDKSIGIFAGGDANYKASNYRYGKITIGDSFEKNNPSIGMFSNNPNTLLVNYGTIEIGKNSAGMVGFGNTVINETNGTINITKDGGVGMYLGDGATGTNNGTITTVGSPKDAIGVVVGKNSEFTNNGTIHIDSAGGAGIVIAGGVVKNYGNIEVSGGAVRSRTDNTYVVQVLSNRVKPVNSDLGVYVDTLGRTKPIEGLSNLGLNNADLLIGAEATEKTNATEVTVGNNVLDPFNKSIQSSGIANWNVKTGSLVWEADSEIQNNQVAKVTLKKQSYAKFADSETAEEVAKGLDEKYTETSADSKDKQVFNYLNTLSDAKTLARTYREIDGNQYINVQQRIAQTDNILENKLSDLQKENADKSGHHVSTFFNKDKHEARTPEIADSSSSTYGISYLFNNADAKQGIYAGTIINRFKLKDNGRSKENVAMFKLGAYKTFDLNSLEWTLSGDGFVSQNDMKRRFVIGNNVYENKADYNAYGFAFRNELGKAIQIGENVTVKPYAALKLGYGRFSNIKEKDGTLNMEVKSNDFYSVKPSAGVEFGYSNPISENAKFKASLRLSYEHELGKIEDKVNEAKFTNTNTKINLKGAKDERRGNFKSNLKVGFEAGNFGFSVNGGYDTKDKNAHAGVGLGVSF